MASPEAQREISPAVGQQDEQSTKDPSDAQKTMSKNQTKRLSRQERWLETRPERRKLEKEKRRQKRQEIAKLRDANMISPALRRTLMKDSGNKFRVVIDMDFEGLMTAAEISKAAKQVGRIYTLNRHSKNPCQLYITSLSGEIRDRFAKTCAGYSNWDANVTDKDYLDAFLSDTCNEESRSILRDKIRPNVIYLTGDAEDDLPDVDEILKDESKIFVIGGLVDHNRHKDLCLKRAQERQVRTARLPIKQFVKLCQRHILSTVAAFEIMLHVLGHHEPWQEAFLKAIPKRKIKQEELDETPDEDNNSAKQTIAKDAANC